MKGHEDLIAMRRQGYTPSAVWLDLDPDSLEMWRVWPSFIGVQWRKYPGERSGFAHVLIEPKDSVPRLDLRFLTGLQAWVAGSDLVRVKQMHQACIDAGAERVLTTVHKPDARGDLKAVAMFDTDGIFQGEFNG